MRKLLVVMAAGLLALGAGPAAAQVRLGGNLSWGNDTDLGLGARLNLGLGRNLPLEGLITFDYFLPGEWAPGLDDN